MGSGNSALKHQLTDKQDASAELTQDCPGGRDSSGAMEDKKSRGARSDPESLADLRCQAETMWKSKLGNVELLDRQSYVELLQSVGHTFQEANILLKECPGSSYIRVKDFLDFLFASPKVDKEDVPTSLQSRDDGEKTEKAMIDSLQEALAASEKRADQQAQLLEELAEKVRQLQATQAHKQDALSPASLLLDKQKEMMEQALALQEQFEEDEALEEDEELQEEGGSKLKEEEKEEEVQDEEEKEKSSRRREVDQAKHWRFQGIAYGASGNFNEMKQLLEKALALFHKHYEEEHPEIALTLIFLSKAYQSLKDHDMAKKELYEVGKILSFHKRLILPLRFTVKEGPSVLRYIEEATFLGRFKAGAKFIYASYPGKFKGGWHILVSDDGEYSEESVACVYCCTRQEGLGEHVPDRRDSKAPCYCRRIYGEGNPKNRNHITFGYLFEVGPPYDDAEHMKNARETAAAMNAVLVRKDASPKEYREAVEKAKKAWSDHGKRPAWGCKWYDVWFDNMEKGVDTGQKPVVVYYPNMVGLGKVSMEDLSNPDVPLWDSDSSNRGLGGSQKVEVATMDCMRQQHGPGSARDYIEMDVTTFMNLSLSVDDRVIGWNEDKGKWMSGVITRKGELEPRNKEDACFRWTVQVHESEECFETSRIRPDKGEMDGLEEKLVQKDFVRSLKKSLPKGQQLISTCPRKEWLQDGAPAMTFDIRSQDVASIQKLCSDVLCGDFEVSFNRAAFQHQTNTAGSPGEKIDYWQLQVNKTEFVKAYKSMLMSSTRLTPHQQDRLSKLDGSQHFHLKAAAGSGKTFVAAHKVVNTLLEKDEGRVLFVAPCKSLCLHFVRWLLAMDTGFGAEERICSRLKLMCEPYKSFMTVSVTDKKQLQLPEEKSSVEAQFILVVDEAHDIFRSDVDQGLLKETLRRSNQCILLSDLSQSSAWDQNYHDLGHYDEVYLTQNVRSTERVVLGAKPFQLSPEHEQGDVVSIGSNGPPLKTYIFEREETGSPPFQEYCRHIIAALKHVVSSYPGLSFHHNVAIIVPDLDFLNSFQEHLKKALKEEIVQTTLSKRLGLISFEESLSYLVSPDAADEGSIEELILDSIGNAKGLEQLIVIVVGMDAQIKSQGDAHDLATRARLYQSITRAQLTAVVVNELLPDGWLAHLATCKLKEGQFQKQEAHMESDTAVATKLVQEIQARGPEERPAHREDPPLETIATALPNGSEEPAASAPSRSPSKPSAPPTEQKKTVIGMRPSSVWDTSQNSTPSPIYDLKFDPMKPQSAFKMLKSQLRQVPLPATCPCPEDVLVCWYNSADEKLSGGELQRRKRLYLFHRNGAFLRREDFWFFAASEASEDPELAARAVRGATRYIFEGRYAVAPAERRVTVTWDRRAFADCTGAAAAPREVRFGPWGAFGRGDGFVYDLEELSERSKRPGVKPLAWPDHQLSEETLKDLEEQRKKDGSWNPENLWFFTADLGGRHRGHV